MTPSASPRPREIDAAMCQPVIAEIFSQGDEVITGQIVDTNAGWLAERLNRLGLRIARHSAVGDRLELLVGLLREIAPRADLCICTGGLGPTVDDLTAEAVSSAFHLPLEPDAEALAQIERYFARRGYTMPPVNRKQALLPKGSRRLDNFCGTAPGFALQAGRCLFAFLPGVPGEMKMMFERQVEPMLVERFRLQPARLVTLRTIGLGESALQQRLESLVLPSSVHLGFRAAMPENEVKLLFPFGFPLQERAALVRKVSHLLGDAVFSIDGPDGAGGALGDVIGRLLQGAGATLAVGETLSSGQIAWLCRGQPTVLQSLVAASPARLWKLLDLDPDARPEDPEQAGPSMATRLLNLSGATYGLMNLGEIPPAGANGTGAEPSEVVVALADARRSVLRRVTVSGSAERRSRQVAALCLDLLRRTLSEYSAAAIGDAGHPAPRSRCDAGRRP